MKSARGIILYVGKAKNLRRRLASYFQKKKHKRRRIARLVKQVRSIEVVIVRNETESLILENNLIKHYKPRYNRRLKSENSGYPYIVLTAEALPRFVAYRKKRYTRAIDEIKEKRFGPYLSVHVRDTVLAYVNETYGLRTCDPLEDRACLMFHMHKCTAVCEGRITRRQYLQDVKRAMRFLSSKQTHILTQMKKQMQAFADELKFERAQHIKTQVEAIERALINQVVERDIERNQIIMHFDGDSALVAEVKRGILLGVELHSHSGIPAEVLADYLRAAEVHDIIVNDQALQGKDSRIALPDNPTTEALMQICQLNHDYRRAALSI